MTFLGEITEFCLQQNIFLENLMPTLNKETKVKDWHILLFSFFPERCQASKMKSFRENN